MAPASPRDRTLVIVPCSARKIWDLDPSHGPARACAAYVGTPFKVNREYAERVGDRWVILSAKYGFIPPEFTIPGPYDVSFNRKRSDPVTVDLLRQQIHELELLRFDRIICLGGRAYREIVESAFQRHPVRIIAPFAGLPLGKALQATKRAVAFSEKIK